MTAMTRVPSSSPWRSLVAALTAPVPLLKGLKWRWIGYMFIASALFTLVDVQWWLLQQQGAKVKGIMIGSLSDLLPAWFVRRVLTFAPQLLALVIATNLPARRLPKAATLTLALLVASIVAAAPYALGDPEPGAALPAMLLELLGLTLQGFTSSGVFVLAFFLYRHDTAVAAALQRAELDRVALRKKTLESGLQLLQARVEPRFLVDTLQGVGALYETDRQAADRMLDHLIVYLRAALPQMRSSTSTLGQEVRLAQAYLAIERIRLEGALEVGFAVPADLTSVAFPPMVLLPAIAAIVPGDGRNTDAIRTVHVEARDESGVLAIALSCTGTSRISTDAIDGLRSRLSALYGAAARLDVESAGQGRAIAELRVPHEQTAQAIDAA